MRVAAAAIVQAESSRVSPGSGRASHQGRDDSFAQTFYRSLGKGDSHSPAPSLEATPGTPSDGISVAMPSAENAGTPERAAPARSVPPASAASPTAEGELALAPAASAAGDARGEARPAAGVQTGAEPTAAGVDYLAAVGSPPIATQTTSRGHAWPETTLPPAGQGPLHGLAERQWSKIVPESRDAAAQGENTVAEDSNSGSALPGAAAPPSPPEETVYPHPTTTATPLGGFGTDNPPHLPPRASRAPVAATATDAGARLARVFATPTVAASTATNDGTRPVRSPATPLAASAPVAATPFGGFGTDNPPHLPPRASRAPIAATPLGGFGTDGPPQLPPRASHAPVAVTEMPSKTTADGARPARVFPIPLAASAPGPANPVGAFGTDSPPQLAPRASRAPIAVTEILPKATDAGTRQALVFATPTAIPVATNDGTRLARRSATPVETSVPEPATPFGGFGTDSPPPLPPRASHAPVAATPFRGFGTDSPPQLPPRASRAPVAATVLTPTAERAKPARVFATPTAASAPEPATLVRGFATDTPPILPQRAAHAPVATSPKPAPAGPPILSPTTAPPAPPAVEPSTSVAPAGPALAESRVRTREASTEKPARAQDGTDSPSAEPSVSLAASIAAPNLPVASSQTHHPPEIASAKEPIHAPRDGEGKETGDHAAPGVSLPTPLAHGQDGLRAEAQATASLTQAQLQMPPPLQAPTAGGPTSTPLADPRGAAHLPAHAASLAAQVVRDEGLSMTVLPHAAHMAIESPNGDLDLHLRVRQGSAEITVGGSMAHLFEARAPEARTALAGEGLALGRFDSGQPDGGQHGQPAPENPERAGEAPPPHRPDHGAPLPTPTDGRIHVTA